MSGKTIAYWVTTSLVGFALLSGGTAQLLHQRETVEGILALGYPAYVVTILGAWKVLGGATLLLPRLPLLKEWAYAGAFFDLTGAAASHAACGDYGRAGFHVAVPLLLAGVALASWALRPPARGISGGVAQSGPEGAVSCSAS